MGVAISFAEKIGQTSKTRQYAAGQYFLADHAAVDD